VIRRMNVLIVPDEGGPARRLNIPTFLIRVAAWLLLIVIIGLVVAFFGYARFIHKAFDWDRLAKENEQLRDTNRRIVRVAKEVADSRQALVNVVRSLQEEHRSPRDSVRLGGGIGRGNLSDEALALLKGRLHSPEQFLSYGLPSLMPVMGFISQRFSDDPLFPERSHRGIDIAGRTGAPVAAAASGRVIFEGWTPYFGNCIILSHGGTYNSFYGHNKLNMKRVGEEVKRGEPIALLGTSGRSSAPHVHFEIWKDGVAVDPMKVLQIQ